MEINNILEISLGIVGGILIYKTISYIPVILMSTIYMILKIKKKKK